MSECNKIQKNEDDSTKGRNSENNPLENFIQNFKNGNKQYEIARKEVEKSIKNGTRITDHRIKL